MKEGRRKRKLEVFRVLGKFVYWIFCEVLISMKMFLINLKIDIGVTRGVFMYNFYVSDGRMMVFNEGFV